MNWTDTDKTEETAASFRDAASENAQPAGPAPGGSVSAEEGRRRRRRRPALFPPGERLFSRQDLVRLIWPLMIEQFLAILVGMADTMMVSSAGEAAVSGVSLVDMINALLNTIFASLATGGAVVTAQLLGAGRRREAQASGVQLIWLAAMISAGITVLTLVFRQGLMSLLFGAIEADVMEAGLTYLLITALSFPALALYNAGAALFRATGNSRVSMYVSVMVNLVNVAGNAVCIFGLRMGVAGVALPSLISRTLGAAVILLLLRRPEELLTLRGAPLRPDGGMMKRILRIAVPSGVEGMMFQLGRLLVVSLISLFGTAQIAANAVANNLDGFGVVPGQAMALAIVTVVGQCVGAGDDAQAAWYAKRMVLFSTAAMAVWNGCILLTLPFWLGVYNISAEASGLAFVLIWIHNGIGILLWSLAFVLPGALRAASDVKFVMAVGIASMWVFRIGTSWLLGLLCQWGAVGVWIGMVLDWICRSTAFVIRFASGKWRGRGITAARK